MSQPTMYPPVSGERLLLVQPRTIDTLADIQAAQADLARQARGAMCGGSFALGRTVWVLREFFEGTDAVLFVAGADLLIGRTVSSVEAQRAHDAGKGNGTRKATRPGVYVEGEMP